MPVDSSVESVMVKTALKSGLPTISKRVMSNIAFTILGAVLLFDAISRGVLPLPY
ncbi:hypothetical protein VHP8226_03430 [Vibrio hippocampi]|uniref:Uncharacterized protein n=1 Tax=Vibrio hippocampi TaxID=654686 RepID=A0ABN8DPT4_9VIBR|nr:hypothetical protein VHP8226_03430 [Vibrio hippocampi]